ncbi:MAG: hypothetical protein UX17_C0068G0007 [Parcubacteria group bacterium GW2011_GWC2_45_7]|nr:MAG: hypothetical protein UX17_C0068G0007 [Parcubacteria group bacterium GW2011_GWC2_45_7]
MSIKTTTLTGAAGESYVMYKLLRMGYVAGLLPRGAPNSDVIVTSVDGKRTAVIQVKTRNELGSDGGWHMKKKHEELISANLFYCFVDFQEIPIVYVIPSKIVAALLKESHQVWLNTPGRNGLRHQDTEMRRLLPFYKNLKSVFLDDYLDGWLEKYKENWKILNLD